MKTIEYDRQKAVNYAREWAFSRNPNYYDFSFIGGDCTNYVSQCLFAGCNQMNFSPNGWYYTNSYNRAPAWTGVEFFYNFLINNNGLGPFAEEVNLSSLQVGDFIQLGTETNDFYHTPIVVGFNRNIPLVAAHTNDAYNRLLTSYNFAKIRCLRIIGARVED